jgi:elongation factor P
VAISTADFRTGLTLELEGEVFYLLEFQHVKPGKGGAFVRTRLRNLRSGNVFERTFRAGERFEPAMVERKELQFLYRAGEDYVFMDTESFDQVSIPGEELGDSVNYLKEGLLVSALTHNERRIGVELPNSVGLRVAETDPGLKGDTASGGSKPAKLESGAVVQVPLFIGQGDLIRVDTRTGRYLERAVG